MGDAGAYFLGYVLAATSILGSVKVTTITSLLPILMLFLVPVVDTSQVIIKRLLSGKNPLSTPGRDHLHHRLLAVGFSQRHSAIILWGFSLAGGIIAMRLQHTRQMAIIVAAIGIAMLLVLTVWLRMLAIVHSPDIPTPNPEDKR